MPEKEIHSVVEAYKFVERPASTGPPCHLRLDDLKKLESFTSLFHLLYMFGARHYHGSETMGIPYIEFYLLLDIQRASSQDTTI